MYQSKYCFLFLLLLPFATFAQGRKDSIGLANANLSQFVYADSIQLAKMRFAQASSYYLIDLMPNRVSRAGVAYSFERGHFIPAQGATTINSGGFATEGTAKIGTVKLFGSLNYQKIFEDSTRYAHQTRSNTTTPYYFGSPGYVHYERTIYAFNAMASKSIWQDKLTFSFETNYKVGDHFSTNDPRGSVGEYQFNLKGILGYRFSKTLKAGLGYGHGYGRESINIGYKNPRYYESSAFPVYYNHLVNGYREWDDALKNRTYDDKMVRNGADLFMDLHTNTLGDFYLNGSFLKENQHYFYSNSSGFTDYTSYGLETTKVNLLWLNKSNRLGYGATVNFQSQTGKDFNLTYQANNYIYNGNNVTAKLFVNKYAEANTHSFYLAGQQYSEERTDGISGNNVYYNNLLLSLGYGLNHSNTNHTYFAINLTGSYNLPLASAFKVVQQPGYFTQNVINRDYIFNTATSLGGQLKMAYGFPIFRTMRSAIAINTFYLRKLEEQTIESAYSSLPGKDRFATNMSLNLYF
ncbi:DUF6850 family outer membrane beta-barrel protein [Pedobacter sp. ASV12]|uniref:DUF6850 family outer membrane beta-barrel protein n=1 Tax=Pedobacter sp. ASV12 TaxID=2795120 RepID=UPI0018EE214E|nr:DUF6850 family outer membrane beta-barrel protein [Pedobacter sp. ASV12]